MRKAETARPRRGTRAIPAGVNESESRHGIRNLQKRDVRRAVRSVAAFVSSRPDTWCDSYQLKNPYRRNLVEVPLKRRVRLQVAPRNAMPPA